MKYLRSYRLYESSTVKIDCEDILIDLSDNGVKYSVSDKNGDITIYITQKIELKKYGDNFERLFDYLESLGYKLDKSSYYEGESWEPYVRCPNCNSNSGNITALDDTITCDDCGHMDYYDEFNTSEHPLTKGELEWSIKNNDRPDNIYLKFTK